MILNIFRFKNNYIILGIFHLENYMILNAFRFKNKYIILNIFNFEKYYMVLNISHF